MKKTLMLTFIVSTALAINANNLIDDQINSKRTFLKLIESNSYLTEDSVREALKGAPNFSEKSLDMMVTFAINLRSNKALKDCFALGLQVDIADRDNAFSEIMSKSTELTKCAQIMSDYQKTQDELTENLTNKCDKSQK